MVKRILILLLIYATIYLTVFSMAKLVIQDLEQESKERLIRWEHEHKLETIKPRKGWSA